MRALDKFKYDPLTGLIHRKHWRRGWEVVNNAPHHLGYLYVMVDGVRYPQHVLAYLLHTGTEPSESIDHINQIRSDNRWCNLRVVDHAENMRNKTQYSNNTSGETGVNKKGGRWTASYRVAGQSHHLGTFSTKEEAAAARQEAAAPHFHTNHGKHKPQIARFEDVPIASDVLD